MPLIQALKNGHLLPQLPQLLRSVQIFLQVRSPSKEVHMARLTPLHVVQTLLVQVWLMAQVIPHPPQLVSLVAVFAQAPLHMV